MDDKVEYNNIIYQIDTKEKTAGVFNNTLQKSEDIIFIPTSINYQSDEYYVTSILREAFKGSKYIKAVQFSTDSKLQKIEEKAFGSSSIESINIPSQVTIIEDNAFAQCEKLSQLDIPIDSNLQTFGKESLSFSKIECLTIPSKFYEFKKYWCVGMKNLNHIHISPKNPYMKMYENKFVIRKSSIEHSNYNQLVFCLQNVKMVTIPNFISEICPLAFNNCVSLQKVNFQSGSNIKLIGDYSFYGTKIEKISIPSSCSFLGKRSFCNCSSLRKIEIQRDSNICEFKDFTFTYSSIGSILIPSNLLNISGNAFFSCSTIVIVEISKGSQLSMICNYIFEDQNIYIMVPVDQNDL